MAEYRTERVPTSPVIREIDGRFYVEVTNGPLTLQSEIGPWFVSRVFELAVLPKLKPPKTRGL